MRLKGQNPRFGARPFTLRKWLRRAWRAQVRQRFEPVGAEKDGKSHFGLNWKRSTVAEGDMSVMRRAWSSSAR